MTEITQADRDAALHLAMRATGGLHPRDVQQVLEGRWDKNAIVQAFARHRQHGYDQGYYDGRLYDGAEERAAIVAMLEKELKEPNIGQYHINVLHGLKYRIEQGRHSK